MSAQGKTPLVGAYWQLRGTPPVSVLDALRVGHVARRAVMSTYGSLTGGGESWRLSGHQGELPAQSGHRHALYVPRDDDGDGLIDHLLVYVPDGLDMTELNAVATVPFMHDPVPGWQLEVRLRRLFAAGDSGGVATLPWCRPARVWRSVTPFLLSRHPKRFRDGRPKLNDRGEQIDGAEDQLRRELHLRDQNGLPTPPVVRLERIACPVLAAGAPGWGAFERRRPGARAPVRLPAYGFEVELASPAVGPLVLGHGSHFGLGLFAPAPEEFVKE